MTESLIPYNDARCVNEALYNRLAGEFDAAFQLAARNKLLISASRAELVDWSSFGITPLSNDEYNERFLAVHRQMAWGRWLRVDFSSGATRKDDEPSSALQTAILCTFMGITFVQAVTQSPNSIAFMERFVQEGLLHVWAESLRGVAHDAPDTGPYRFEVMMIRTGLFSTILIQSLTGEGDQTPNWRCSRPLYQSLREMYEAYGVTFTYNLSAAGPNQQIQEIARLQRRIWGEEAARNDEARIARESAKLEAYRHWRTLGIALGVDDRREPPKVAEPLPFDIPWKYGCDRPDCPTLAGRRQGTDIGQRSPSLRCSRCHKALYCAAACQQAHWPLHKRTCKAST